MFVTFTFILFVLALISTSNVGGVTSVESSKYNAILEPYSFDLSVGIFSVFVINVFPTTLAVYTPPLDNLYEYDLDSSVSS